MKKILAMILASLLLLSFASCNKGSEDSETAPAETEAPEEVLTYESFKYAVNEYGDYEIVGYENNGVDSLNITVPSSIDGRPVTGIGADAFKASTVLKSITLPASVEEIGFEAFYNCTSLESIELPESLKTLDGSAFIYCSSLSSVTLSSSLKEVGMSCIRGTSVTDIYVPSDLEFTKWDNISFFNMDYPDPITVHVAEGSWADANFEEVFGDSVKTYN